jgi:hypothetical protein
MEPGVGLILVKPILKGLTCRKNQNGLGFPMIPSGYPLGIMGNYDDGLDKNVMSHLHKPLYFHKMHWLFT